MYVCMYIMFIYNLILNVKYKGWPLLCEHFFEVSFISLFFAFFSFLFFLMAVPMTYGSSYPLYYFRHILHLFVSWILLLTVDIDYFTTFFGVGRHLQHVEIPRAGIKPTPHL